MKTRHIFLAILFSLILMTGFTTADANASPAPSLQAVADSGSQITLDWIGNNKWVSGYKIERRQSPEETFVLIAETGKVRTYTDTFELNPETTYEYRVRAIKKKGKTTEISIQPSTKGAIKGAATGALIGSRFGPTGLAVGTGIGGILGYVLGED